MTHQKTAALLRLRRAIHADAPLRGTRQRCLLMPVLCLLSSVTHAAEGTRPAYSPPPPAVSSGGIVQIIFSLLLVLAAIMLVAWLLKRMNPGQQGTGNLLKVLGGVAIGQRERIVLVEVHDTWLVVGVGPGQIRTLHTLQRPDDIDPGTASQSAGKPGSFSAVLSSALGSLSSGKHRQRLAAGANISETNVRLAQANGRSHDAP